MKKKIDIKSLVLLEIAFFIYSLSSMFSKQAMYNNPTILHIVIFYGLSLFMLGVYAIIWQQVLKKLDLSVAFANKGITIIWGIIWGVILFKEKITIGMIIGALIVILGIIVMMRWQRRKLIIFSNFTRKEEYKK